MKQAHSLKTIKFVFLNNGNTHDYKCDSVKNSTEFRPGVNYCKAEVDALCNSRQWDVTIIARK